VGDEACAGCHRALFKTYRQHPMGRSLASVAATRERYDEAAHNPFDAFRFRYQVARRGDQVYHSETAVDGQGRVLAEGQAEVHFAVGSGQRGRSYLINRDGYLFMSPITWYPQKGIWDLSPGYVRKNLHFGRPVVPDCLFCHCNQVEPVEHTANRYAQPIFRGLVIGCERCHGPGEVHVARHRDNPEPTEVDDTIVNPRRLDFALREAVCQQCHLQGEQRVLRRGRKPFDYRPGLPLHLFWSDFVKPAEQSTDPKFVGTVEQMYASPCFRASSGKNKMGCISCHDPHERPAPEARVAYYRDRCLHCHADQSCSLPRDLRLKQRPDDSCIVCHMPPTGSDINHTSITDHRIPRQAEKRSQPPMAAEWPRLGQMPLVYFHRDLVDPADPEVARDLGLALMDLAEKQPDALARSLAAMASPLLDNALKADPNDLSAWEAKGSALWFRGRLPEALAAYETALQKAPQREMVLFLAANLAMRMKRWDNARSYGERVLRVNPWRWEYHQILASVHAQNQEWRSAVQECEATLKLNPAHLLTRQLLVMCLIREGSKARAQAEFDVLLGMSPPKQQEALPSWFARQSR
jgi:hypothetical protein